MFTPRAFAETDLLWLDRLLARDPQLFEDHLHILEYFLGRG